MIDLSNLDNRKFILQEIRSDENQNRKRRSFVQWDCYRDNQHPYVLGYLRSQFSENTISEMPIISSVNLARRVVNQEASIYKNAPDRKFTNLNDDQIEYVETLYSKMDVNQKLMKSNRALKLIGQGALQVVPSMGRLELRVLLPHQYDVIPNEENPEIADGYIISSFDRQLVQPSQMQVVTNNASGVQGNFYQTYVSDGINQKIADADDYQVKQRYVVWTKEYNFIMNGKGEIVSDGDITNPLGIIPFVDVFFDKDFEFWVRLGQTLTDFSIQFNGSLSDLAQVVKMQGWNQAYLKGPSTLIPDKIQVGPNYILKLPVDPNNPVDTEFGYASPSSDLGGSIQYIEMLLSTFLSSRGVDPKTVSGKAETTSYSSGIDRLLAMLDRFEATKEDYDVFENVEDDLFEIIKAVNNYYAGSELLPDSMVIPEETKINVKFHKPEAVTTESEKIGLLREKMELGLMSRVEAIMEDRNVSLEMAVQIDQEINGGMNGSEDQGENGTEEPSDSEDQPDGDDGEGSDVPSGSEGSDSSRDN